MKLKRILAVFVIICLTLSLVACGGSGSGKTDSGNASDDKISITMGIEGGDDLPDAIMGLKFKELIEEKSNGRITVSWYGNGQLGGDDELLQQVMNGSINAALISTSTFSDYSEELDVLQLPFLFKDYETEKKALESSEAQALYKDLEELNLKILAVTEIGMRNFANNTKPIEKLSDLKGIKMRIVPSTLVARAAELVGMTVTPMSYSEIYTGLQQNIIDGEEINLISINLERHYEVLKYVSLINFYTFPSALTFNLDFYNGLSDEDKALFDECKEEAFNYSIAQTEQKEEDSLQVISNAGLQLNEISEEAKAEFKTAVQPMYDEYAAKSENMAAFIKMAQGL
ncbi:TRAP transporter substrate-binding protein [Sinanaerobacter chloroacetimidivorans]|uniref:TRAP transporter substrate-binding protein n=1 Tax=Sinanaerobacter chloroacetimidivorans TaxID=2818044 RepID=A0A8J7W1X2_9FIRM|nr:TRAP transporter substrate-binding protein [Sinanaerobacter chloroacetimidivorans]MBR0598018.1 TRAP transporter substrate-binding protein [Sinanaerobacter chloroacetimidivorans]